MQTLLGIGLHNAFAATALALAAAAISRFTRRPALAHALWLLVLLKLVTPPLFPVSVPWPDPDGEPATPPATRTESSAPAVEDGTTGGALALLADAPDPAAAEAGAVPEVGMDLPESVPPRPAGVAWEGYVAVVWLGGSVLWFAWAGLHVGRFRRLLRLARRAPVALQAEADALSRRLGLRRPPAVWLVPGAVSPMVWALGGAPRLLFPSGLLRELDDEGRASLLAHELAHVRRRDHWVRLLEILVSGLYWWHPAVWWARHELREAEEQCCDAWAVWALGGRGRPYALALVHTAAFVSHAWPPLPVGASGVGQVRSLKRRLTMILRAKTARSLSWPGRVAVLSLGLLLLPLFAVQAQPGPASADRPASARDARDQQIEVLRQAIKILEEQKRAEAAGATGAGPASFPAVAPTPKPAAHAIPALAPHPVVTPAVAQAAPPALPSAEPKGIAADDPLLATAKDLEKMIAAKRKELDLLEAKYRDVRAKLGVRDPYTRRAQTTPVPARPADVHYGTVPAEPQPKPAPPLPAPHLGAASDARSRDVEKRLELLQRQLEELRREIQRSRSSALPDKGSLDTITPPAEITKPAAPITAYPARRS